MKYQQSLASLFLVSSLLLASCGSNTPSTESDSPSDTSSEETTEETASETETEEVAAAPEKGEIDLESIVGTKEEGWLPKIIADKGLKKGMTPEETGKIFPGAENISEFGFSEVETEDVPGLVGYEFYFAKDDSGQPTQLQSVKLIFDPSLNSQEFYEQLANDFAEKYGEVEQQDIEEGIVTWVGPDFTTAQLTKGTSEFDGFVFSVNLPE